MPSTLRLLAIACVLITVVQGGRVPFDSGTAAAQQAATVSTQDLRTWVQRFPVQDSQMQETALAKPLVKGDEFRPFTGQTIVGLWIHGLVRFTSERGMIRVVMVDDRRGEHLVYETFALIAPTMSFRVRNACRETCLLPPTVPSSLKVEVVDASIDIQAIVTNQIIPSAGARRESAARTKQRIGQVRQAQEKQIVDLLNRRIKAKGLKWIAGETAISRLSYAERKTLLSCAAGRPDAVANLQGAEYYRGGILEVTPRQARSLGVGGRASSLVPAFDWRSRHGADRFGSPYYDNDGTGSGWLTSVKMQRCGDCWAHSALGATEAVANLYFNQHVDVDLSEQELVSCSGAGGCGGGHTGSALAYVQSSGVVEETCFPESGWDEACQICPVPRERFLISGFEEIRPWEGEDNIKRRLIQSGPLSFGISSWWHALVLVGYEREPVTGETIWILKNSWGPYWGENGYGRVMVILEDIYLTYNLHTPVVSLFSPFAVACNDADRDGYFNWGISRDIPATCGDVPPINDCDDSDPAVAFMTEEGECTAPPDTTAPAVTVAAAPAALWPPNGRMVPVTVSGAITDDGSGVDANTAAYAVADEYGRIVPRGPVPLGADGSYRVTVLLEAGRTGQDRDGRHYTIRVTARDRAGNAGSSSGVVIVPHDMRVTGSKTATPGSSAAQ